MFGRDVSVRSYILAAALTAGFSLFVNIIAHFSIQKINMVESLKSVE
jgi:putative ABC transport system permease protein